MLGCIQPMSSPMMTRMLGFCCCCAAAGRLAAATTANSASKPSHKFRDRLIVRLLETIGWLVYADGALAPSSMRSHALGLRIEPGGSHAGLVQRSTIPALVFAPPMVCLL